MQNNVFFDSAKLNWTDLGDGVSRQIMGYDDKIMLVKVKFEKGSTGALHKHPHSQASYVAEGKFEITIGGDKKILATGDSFYAPGDVTHGVYCLEAGVLVDIFSPCRKDFL